MRLSESIDTSTNFVIQSSLHQSADGPRHVAVIMDGNGRWARQRRLPRSSGHRRGANAVTSLVELARRSEVVAHLTLFAFSSDNWNRLAQEVQTLMRLLERFLKRERSRLQCNDIRLTVIGRRDRLSPELRASIELTERATLACAAMHLRLAIDYSARGEAARVGGSCAAIPDVDLMIRTGGEKRLSDFLLLQSAYAELLFLDVLWPDFGASHWQFALHEFSVRQRRFGAILEDTP